jgi:hypothetical protein
VRNDLDARRKRGKSVDVIAVAVRQDDGAYGLRCDLCDIVQKLFCGCRSRFGIDHDYAAGANNDAAVAASTFDPVNVGL